MNEVAALLIDPRSRTVQPISIAGYDDIKTTLGASSRPEGNTLCKFSGSIYLQVWVDCNQFRVAPAFVSELQPLMVLHGQAVLTAYDLSTGEGVPLSLSAEEFAQTIQWEDRT